MDSSRWQISVPGVLLDGSNVSRRRQWYERSTGFKTDALSISDNFVPVVERYDYTKKRQSAAALQNVAVSDLALSPIPRFAVSSRLSACSSRFECAVL
jgi:hypothetical protein